MLSRLLVQLVTHSLSSMGEAASAWDVDLQKNSRCYLSREHEGLPCCHIPAVLHYLVKRSKKPDVDTLSRSSSRCAAKAFSAAFSGASVTVPLECDVGAVCAANPPPLYKQFGRRTGPRQKKDIADRQKRLKRAGESDKTRSTAQQTLMPSTVTSQDDDLGHLRGGAIAVPIQ